MTLSFDRRPRASTRPTMRASVNPPRVASTVTASPRMSSGRILMRKPKSNIPALALAIARRMTLSEAHEPSEGIGHGEIDDEHETPDLEGAAGRHHHLTAGEGELGQGDERDQRSRHDELDQEIAEGRQHDHQGL